MKKLNYRKMDLKLKFDWRQISKTSLEIYDEMMKGRILNEVKKGIFKKIADKYTRYINW